MSRGGALAILLVFTFLGPAFGGVTFAVLLTAWTAFFHPEANEGLTALIGVLVYLPVAYLSAGLQFLVTGIVAAGAALWRGKLEWWPALGAAALLGAFYGARAGEDVSMLAILLASHIGGAASCLLMCRLILGRRAPPVPDVSAH